MAYRQRGLWSPADTAKGCTALETADRSDAQPWMPWEIPHRDLRQDVVAAASRAAVGC